ncbi:helix-turn-helix transcriptional regulator [Natronomonas halophila]|uniref:helix-turn-helix transcriptional regulator n=1 Tax=Natronomonas halophila TaxID=2747817 RepID=UPI0015B56F18|nr:helix-turn-helix transcriptional regulator [Natronomonas halophila]QLD84164.1 helix-turn-helix transcriptional regulator [Natronomonas halophila]
MFLTDGGTSEDRLTSEDAFAILGNEYRAEIIRTLGEEQGTEGPRPTLAFSDLYSKADVDIATSQFNYHLQKLVGPFIDKTENGYRLRHEAVALYRTILAGTYTETASLERFQVGVDCYYCDAPIEARYADRRFTVLCSGCGREYSDTTAPPSIVEGNHEALLNRMNQYARHRILAFSKGVCSICANDLRTRVLPGEELGVSGSEQLDVFVHRSCDHCGAQQYMSVGLSLLYNPELIAFFQAQGRDITTTPIWELEFAMTDRFVDVRSTDPWEIALHIEQDGAELELVVDDTLTVLD